MTGLVEMAVATKTKLIEKTWVGRNPNSDREEYCLLTARYSIGQQFLGQITDKKDVQRQALLELRLARIMYDEAKSRGSASVIRFNDTPGRTFGEVMDFMDSVILKAKEAELADER